MLDVIYNDPLTNLSLIDNVGIERAYIVDGSLNIYMIIEYWDFDIDEISETRKNAVNKYFDIKNIDNTSTHREMLARKSLAAFKQFLQTWQNN